MLAQTKFYSGSGGSRGVSEVSTETPFRIPFKNSEG